MKEVKDNRTAGIKEKLADYQHYVETIHKSFKILKEREALLLEQIEKCHSKNGEELETSNTTFDSLVNGTSENLAFKNTKSELSFPSSDRAVQMSNDEDSGESIEIDKIQEALKKSEQGEEYAPNFSTYIFRSE